MLNPVGLLAPEPAHDHLEPLAGTHEPIRSRAIARHGTLVTSKIRCTSISQPLSQQDFISPRVNSTVTGAEVGDHVGHPFSWSTLVIATPTFGTLSSLSCGPIAPARPKPGKSRPREDFPTPDHQQIRELTIPLREPHPFPTTGSGGTRRWWSRSPTPKNPCTSGFGAPTAPATRASSTTTTGRSRSAAKPGFTRSACAATPTSRSPPS